jgi:DNA repair/transcription protein MET18/MMS19
MNLEPKKRLALFELVDYLFRTHSTKLKKEVGDRALVDGLLAMAQPEKNPACLKLLFSLYSHLGQEWGLNQDCLRDIFQSYVRYYPAEIGGNDSTAAIKKELNDMLMHCFFSNENYAKEAFPRCIEMLETGNSLSVKSKVSQSSTLLI